MKAAKFMPERPELDPPAPFSSVRSRRRARCHDSTYPNSKRGGLSRPPPLLLIGPQTERGSSGFVPLAERHHHRQPGRERVPIRPVRHTRARRLDVLEVVNRGDAQPHVTPKPLSQVPLVFQYARPRGLRLRLGQHYPGQFFNHAPSAVQVSRDDLPDDEGHGRRRHKSFHNYSRPPENRYPPNGCMSPRPAYRLRTEYVKVVMTRRNCFDATH